MPDDGPCAGACRFADIPHFQLRLNTGLPAFRVQHARARLFSAHTEINAGCSQNQMLHVAANARSHSG